MSTKFTELCSVYAECQKRLLNFNRSIRAMAWTFSKQFSEYINMPTSYRYPNKGMHEDNYLKLFNIDEFDNPKEVNAYLELDNIVDGILYFGLGITLEFQENSFPKNIYHIKCGIKLNADKIYIYHRSLKGEDKMIERQVKWDGVSPPDFAPVHEELYNNMIEYFSFDPFTDIGRQNQKRMGYVPIKG